MLSLLTASMFLLIDLHVCLHVPRHGPRTNTTTAKFLIGITPQGTVSFISKGWGGRTSDNFITEHCGLLNKVLLPEYLFLAFRGFDIEDSVGLLLHAYNFLHKRKATADRIGH